MWCRSHRRIETDRRTALSRNRTGRYCCQTLSRRGCGCNCTLDHKTHPGKYTFLFRSRHRCKRRPVRHCTVDRSDQVRTGLHNPPLQMSESTHNWSHLSHHSCTGFCTLGHCGRVHSCCSLSQRGTNSASSGTGQCCHIRRMLTTDTDISLSSCSQRSHFCNYTRHCLLNHLSSCRFHCRCCCCKRLDKQFYILDPRSPYRRSMIRQ